jgi:hypothetical protein
VSPSSLRAGSAFHHCIGWAETLAATSSMSPGASNRQIDGVIGNLEEKLFFVEEYDGTDGCVSPRTALLRFVTVRGKRLIPTGNLLSSKEFNVASWLLFPSRANGISRVGPSRDRALRTRQRLRGNAA